MDFLKSLQIPSCLTHWLPHTHMHSYTLPQPIPVKSFSTYSLVLLTWVLTLPRGCSYTHWLYLKAQGVDQLCVCVCVSMCVCAQSLPVFSGKEAMNLFKELPDLREWDKNLGPEWRKPRKREALYIQLGSWVWVSVDLGPKQPRQDRDGGSSQTTEQDSRLQKGHISACLVWMFSANCVSQVRGHELRTLPSLIHQLDCSVWKRPLMSGTHWGDKEPEGSRGYTTFPHLHSWWWSCCWRWISYTQRGLCLVEFTNTNPLTLLVWGTKPFLTIRTAMTIVFPKFHKPYKFYLLLISFMGGEFCGQIILGNTELNRVKSFFFS